MIEKTRQETRDIMAANGLILQEDGNGVCRIKSFAKKKDAPKRQVELPSKSRQNSDN